MKVAENLGAMVVTYFAGVLHDKYIYMKQGFYAVSILLSAVAIAAFFLAIFYSISKKTTVEDRKEDKIEKETASIELTSLEITEETRLKKRSGVVPAGMLKNECMVEEDNAEGEA